MVGGFAPLKDVPKTMVWQLARWRNTQQDSPIPENSITKAPSAELRPDDGEMLLTAANAHARYARYDRGVCTSS